MLRLPNAALRFRPTPETLAAFGQAAPARTPDGESGRVWVWREDRLTPVDVRLGLSDGAVTEVVSGDLSPDASVVTSVAAPQSTTAGNPAQGSGNPLLPGGAGRGFGRPPV